MKILRTAVCVILAVALVLVLSECDVKEGAEDASEPSAPAATGDEDGAAKESAVISVPPDPSESRQDLVIRDWEAYVTRPRGIQPGTVLNYAVSNYVPSQLPWNCPGDGWLTGNIYEGLLYMYMNDPGDIRGCISESWEHSDDYLTWTFKIREGVKFSDGTVCDAYAVAKAWDYIKEVSPYSLSNYSIASWEAEGEMVFVVHTSAPYGYIEVALSGSRLFVVSPTALALYGIDDNRAAVGTGPYYIDSYTPDVGIVLKANPNYYLEEKMPCIETVNFSFVNLFRDQNVVDALLSGDFDGAAFRNYYDGFENVTVEIYRALLAGGYSGYIVLCPGPVNPMWLNAEKIEVFRTFEVREAMCRFIDFDAVNDSIYDGLGTVQDSLWAAGSSGYVQTDQFYYDPDEGQALLASAGLTPADIKLDDIYLDNNKDLYAAVNQELAKAGIELKLERQNPSASTTPLMQGEWSITFQSLAYMNTSPYVPWSYILKPDFFLKLCWQDIYNPDLYQKMLDEYNAMLGAATWDEMLNHCKTLTAYVQNDFGAIGGVQPPEFFALGSDFKNGVYFSEQHWLQLYYLYQQKRGS